MQNLHTHVRIFFFFRSCPRSRANPQGCDQARDAARSIGAEWLWAKREAQVRGVIESTAGMYGALQGIAGRALEEVQGFALPLLENQAGEDDTLAA